MDFMRVWVCSRGHDPAYIRSTERRPLCPICEGSMSKAKSEGMPVLMMSQDLVEVEVFDEEPEIGTPDIGNVSNGEEVKEEEPFEVQPEKPQRITEPVTVTEPLPKLTPKPTWSRKKGAKNKETEEVRL